MSETFFVTRYDSPLGRYILVTPGGALSVWSRRNK